MTDEPIKQICCASCHEWYDARAAACYLCGEARPDYNHALKVAVETERLNGALGRQTSFAQAEKNVGNAIPTSADGKTGPSDLYRVPYARDLATSIKKQLGWA